MSERLEDELLVT